MRRSPLFLAFVGALSVGAVWSATAGDRSYFGGYQGGGYGYGQGSNASYGGGYGFADGLVGGGFIGAPFTRFPRPSELVPSALTYGTYGVPTVPGIRQAPAGQPTVYVIDGARNREHSANGGSRVLTRKSGRWVDPDETNSVNAGAARVVSLKAH